MERIQLARVLYNQMAGPMQRIHQSITMNMRTGNLTLHSENKVRVQLKLPDQQL